MSKKALSEQQHKRLGWHLPLDQGLQIVNSWVVGPQHLSHGRVPGAEKK